MATYQIRIRRLVLDRHVPDPGQIAGLVEAGLAHRLNRLGSTSSSAGGYDADLAAGLSAKIAERLPGHVGRSGR